MTREEAIKAISSIAIKWDHEKPVEFLLDEESSEWVVQALELAGLKFSNPL